MTDTTLPSVAPVSTDQALRANLLSRLSIRGDVGPLVLSGLISPIVDVTAFATPESGRFGDGYGSSWEDNEVFAFNQENSAPGNLISRPMTAGIWAYEIHANAVTGSQSGVGISLKITKDGGGTLFEHRNYALADQTNNLITRATLDLPASIYTVNDNSTLTISTIGIGSPTSIYAGALLKLRFLGPLDEPT